ncbi:hypothetical protein K438DRAFT_1801669, partial [Mycena galopus ATCC 62051]
MDSSGGNVDMNTSTLPVSSAPTELAIRQEPKQARMCGIGGKGARGVPPGAWILDGKTDYEFVRTASPVSDSGFFVFPDLYVRTEGSYRLKMSLFEVFGIYSAPFYVSTAK